MDGAGSSGGEGSNLPLSWRNRALVPELSRETTTGFGRYQSRGPRQYEQRQAEYGAVRGNQAYQQNYRRGRGNYRRGNSNDFSQNNIRSGRPGFNSRTLTLYNLLEMSRMNSDDVAAKLADKNSELEQLLSEELKADFLVLTLRVLTNLCSANFTGIVTSILSRACSQKFIKSLENYLLRLPCESAVEKRDNSEYWKDVNGFWINLISFFKKIIELLPNKARDELFGVVQKASFVLTTIESNELDCEIDKSVKNDLGTILTELKSEIDKMRERNEKKVEADCEQIYPEPLNSFRELSVVPTVNDLTDQEIFIRPSKIKGAYDSVEQYLDVQFRLVREDFVGPLRSGIQEYLAYPEGRRNTEFRVYKRVYLKGSIVVDNKVGFLISFGAMKYVNWKRSKRFMFGALLCLSSDRFANIVFATVANRDEKYLAQGQLIIEPCIGSQIPKNMFHLEFVMLESKVYFEPYYHILQTLKSLSEENFPMKKYLVDAEGTTSHPQYLAKLLLEWAKRQELLKKQNESLTLPCNDKTSIKRQELLEKQNESLTLPCNDKTSILGNLRERRNYRRNYKPPTYRYKDFEIPLADEEKWPSPEELELDQSQFEAFKCALLQEFAIIQGPPGTGKTHIALQIAGTLLRNRSYSLEGPLLVVCLTNHALDQFLEGILKYTNSLVRVGGRSQNPRLEEHTLQMLRRSHHVRGSMHLSLMYSYQNELKEVLQRIEEANGVLGLLSSCRNIVSPRLLRKHCGDDNLRSMGNVIELLRWLMMGNAALLLELQEFQRQYYQNMASVRPAEVTEANSERNNWMDDELELVNLRNWEDLYEDQFLDMAVVDAFIGKLQGDIRALVMEREANQYTAYPMVYDPIMDMEYMLFEVQSFKKKLQQRLMEHPLRQHRVCPLVNDERWCTYWRWIMECHHSVERSVDQLQEKYNKVARNLNEAKQMADVQIMKDYDVVGVTTTGAARLHSSLRALKSPIVMVEEAAEVLEAHIVSSLTQSCQHLILIGDHKQLRPNTAVYDLGAKYNLNISLFERMINVRGNCTQLSVQHRMRPEIARLVSPSIYETLHNHESVQDYPPVSGVSKNLFFINHNNPDANPNEDSWENPHEAEFLVCFARHLMLQGYSEDDITILCTYTGQMYAVMKERERYEILRNVRITTVDNYQGEENKIILLSLVRNNEEGNIGFLRTENRVCVALSRAREGFYIMGNMQNLTMKPNIWTKIEAVLVEEDGIGDALPLQCQIHHDQITMVKNAKDFFNCPEGGCLRQCAAKLPCNHTCTKVCHVSDRIHEEYFCKEPCMKLCPNGHPCPLVCGKRCQPCAVKIERELKCGHIGPVPCGQNPDDYHCLIQVTDTLPHCGHSVQKPCFSDPETFQCSFPCEGRLPCGHTCISRCHANNDPDHIQYKCYKKCARNKRDCENDHPCDLPCYMDCELCTVEVQKERSCGHYYQIACSEDIEEKTCKKPCKRTMDCGHECKLPCSNTCGDCAVKMEKEVSQCGHKITVRCCEEPTTEHCSGPCQLTLECGHPCRNTCKDLCTKECKAMVLLTDAACGHSFKVPCYKKSAGLPNDDIKLLMHCEEPCRDKLACDHPCTGTCGKCAQGRIHIPCTAQCGNILICGHRCEVPCRNTCLPCAKPCPLKCEHNKCRKKCGEPCTPCQEPCRWGCIHSKCSKRCNELCDKEPCNEPCPKQLKCKHPCVGFCGEPCPPLCRICNKDELTEVLFGDEDEPDARFVFLRDCSHCIESNALSKWLSQEERNIGIKTCPRCKTPITKHMRYINDVKRTFIDVQNVKRKVFGEQRKLLSQQNVLVRRVRGLSEKRSFLLPDFWTRGFKQLEGLVVPVTSKKRRQNLSVQTVEAVSMVLQIIERIINEMLRLRECESAEDRRSALNVIRLIERALPTRGQISDQEVNDIEAELSRLYYRVTLCEIDVDTIYRKKKNEDEVADAYRVMCSHLSTAGKFTDAIKDEVHEQLLVLHRILDLSEMKVRKEKAEKAMIVKAMGFKQGHWYKCRNGHPYAIADCGGAMEVSKCNECGDEIGGTHHRLVPSNSLASEMDGATRAAWP